MNVEELAKRLPNGAYVIISPPLSGKKDFLIKLACLKPTIFITTDSSPEEIIQKVKNNELYFIDCFTNNIGEDQPNTQNIIRVPGPLALNEISVALTQLETKMFKEEKEHFVIINSASTFLMYSNPQAIARFLQVLLAKIKRTNGTAFVSIEEGMHDDKVLMLMKHLMDGAIMLKEENGKHFVFVKGIKELEKWNDLEL
ncbi:MAG: hypothetical protein J7K22_01815 [Nanoarchaeota archaeon]|nr:hypothetical protein [Nanoarchaeota archaeon]